MRTINCVVHATSHRRRHLGDVHGKLQKCSETVRNRPSVTAEMLAYSPLNLVLCAALVLQAIEGLSRCPRGWTLRRS